MSDRANKPHRARARERSNTYEVLQQLRHGLTGLVATNEHGGLGVLDQLRLASYTHAHQPHQPDTTTISQPDRSRAPRVSQVPLISRSFFPFALPPVDMMIALVRVRVYLSLSLPLRLSSAAAARSRSRSIDVRERRGEEANTPKRDCETRKSFGTRAAPQQRAHSTRISRFSFRRCPSPHHTAPSSHHG